MCVELVEVELPGVDVEAELARAARVPVLQVGLGVGAGDARHPDQVDELLHESCLVDRVEDARSRSVRTLSVMRAGTLCRTPRASGAAARPRSSMCSGRMHAIVGDEVERRVDLLDRHARPLRIGEAVERQLQLLAALVVGILGRLARLPVDDLEAGPPPSGRHCVDRVDLADDDASVEGQVDLALDLDRDVAPPSVERLEGRLQPGELFGVDTVAVVVELCRVGVELVGSRRPPRSAVSTQVWKSVPSRVARNGFSGIGRSIDAATPSGSVTKSLNRDAGHAGGQRDRTRAGEAALALGQEQGEVGRRTGRRSRARPRARRRRRASTSARRSLAERDRAAR